MVKNLGQYALGFLSGIALLGLAIMALNTKEGYVRADTGACVGVREAGQVRACRTDDRFESTVVASNMTLEKLQAKYGR